MFGKGKVEDRRWGDEWAYGRPGKARICSWSVIPLGWCTLLNVGNIILVTYDVYCTCYIFAHVTWFVIKFFECNFFFVIVFHIFHKKFFWFMTLRDIWWLWHSPLVNDIADLDVIWCGIECKELEKGDSKRWGLTLRQGVEKREYVHGLCFFVLTCFSCTH